MRIAIAVSAACLSMVGMTAAESVTAAVRRATEIPPQPLSTALQALADNRDFQILYVADVVGQARTSGAQGEFTPTEALDRLLVGTGLVYSVLDDRTVTVAQSEASNQVTGGPRSSEVEEIVVTGSRMKVVGEGPKPVRTFSREEIDRSGQSTVATFLNSLPQVSTATGENSSQLGFGQTSVQLRGLPAGSTLVLLNGRRVHNVGAAYNFGGFFDLNLLPAAAVERIEVLPDGASAIYGSDALAGVVNVILKKDFEGAEVGLRYGFADALEERSGSIAWGKSWERGSFSVVGTYFGRPDRLQATEREVSADKDHRRYGGPDNRRTTCYPGTITSTDGANLPGLNSATLAIPAGLTGTPSIADLAGGAGQTNRCSDLAKYVVVQETERLGAVASAHFELTPSVDLFGEYIYSSTQQFSANNNRSLSNVLLPASNAFNPFGAPVRVSYLFDDTRFQHSNEMHATFARALVGARGSVFGSWDWELTASRSGDRNGVDVQNSLANTANRDAALASSDPATALNLFTSGAPGTDAVLGSLYSPERSNFDSELNSISGFVRGVPFALPGGDVQLVVGAEHYREKLSVEHGTVVADAHRDTASAFSEIRVPLVKGRSPSAGDALAVSAAVRLDRYSDFGSQTSPQAGIEWRPARGWLLRGSYGESFRAPGLYVLYGKPLAGYDFTVVDPRRGGEVPTVAVNSDPNPNLTPELGKSRSLGFVWSSEQLPSLNVGATLWRVEQSDRVGLLLPQDFVNNEAQFPDRVHRGPSVGGMPGPILAVDRSYINFGTIDVTGVDVNADYVWRTSLGDWAPRAALTYTDSYDLKLTPSSSVVDQVSRAGITAWAPRWKGTVSLGWNRGGYSATAGGRYVGSYLDYQDFGANSHRLGDFWLFDLSARLDIGKAFGVSDGMLSHTHASIAVANVLDSLPEWSWYSFSALGYDPAQYDIVGRMVQLSVGMKW